MGLSSCRFQLPRTEEPSGTGLPDWGRILALRVSTSPDGRTIRNLLATWRREFLPRFQLPRTEEPSGTWAVPHGLRLIMGFNFPGRKNHPEPCKGRLDALRIFVSTSPDGRTIRNYTFGRLPIQVRWVSTSPDGRTIRNQRGPGGVRAPQELVSTSPDGRTIRNRSPQKATGGFWFENLQRADPLWPMGPLHVPP